MSKLSWVFCVRVSHEAAQGLGSHLETTVGKGSAAKLTLMVVGRINFLKGFEIWADPELVRNAGSQAPPWPME